MTESHGVDIRLLESFRIKSGCKGPYTVPKAIDYKLLSQRLTQTGNNRLAGLALLAAHKAQARKAAM